ncbi:hypothetical protein LX32DRAFT_33312 [Colletotrichum zoysiae]|uniref:Uncharacterized protein n=1 Tax=Colletotrichum zoysiae TaxID=1216348 RepID=A0AAD9HE11_9PEZI|nr:hypothetical protein LX32DRAFT_33312 [Colletotrichum zoysiae]
MSPKNGDGGSVWGPFDILQVLVRFYLPITTGVILVNGPAFPNDNDHALRFTSLVLDVLCQ